MRTRMPTPYRESESGLAPRSVPVSVIVLVLNEEANLPRCLSTLTWAEQVVVVDSGSVDRSVDIARAHGADTVETHWRGFGPQREFAMRLPVVRKDWVFFVDADEWISNALASEVAHVMGRQTSHAAYWQYFRLVFQGRWIAHSGWYPSARLIRLMDRTRSTYTGAAFSEHPHITGPTARLRHDIVDEDLKGLSSWVRKHVRYAELEAERREALVKSPRVRLEHESRLRQFLKDRVAPRVPARPLVTFLYMYVVRMGFLDGRQGLLFCFLHAWFQTLVRALRAESQRRATRAEIQESPRGG
jgi:glycosyltransferase involved in cell wall biosynthesis